MDNTFNLPSSSYSAQGITYAVDTILNAYIHNHIDGGNSQNITIALTVNADGGIDATVVNLTSDPDYTLNIKLGKALLVDNARNPTSYRQPIVAAVVH